MSTAEGTAAEQDHVAAGKPLPGDDEPPVDAGGQLLLRRLTMVLVAMSAGFYLLVSLGGMLRPFLIAVLLCYAISPLQARLNRYMPRSLSLLIIGSGLAVGFYAIGRMVFANASEVWQQMPRYLERAERLVEHTRTYAARIVPTLGHPHASPWQPIHFPVERVGAYLQGAFGIFAGFLAEATLVGLYVVFILAEASRFPRRSEMRSLPSGPRESSRWCTRSMTRSTNTSRSRSR